MKNLKENCIETLNKLETHYVNFDKELDKYCELIRDFFDTELIESVFDITNIIIEGLVRDFGLEGSSHDTSIVYDWVFSHKFGEEPMIVFIDDVKKEIKSNEEFVEFMLEKV